MKNMYYLIIFIFLSLNTVFAQRIATHTLSNFNVNTSTNKFSFDIYSQSTGINTVRVGLTSYYVDFNNTALALPVLSNVNAKYTSGSATGDYNAMTVQITLGKIAVSILFTGNGDGTGDVLLTTGPTGERICTVTLDITNQSATAMVGWDLINSTMNTPTLQSITNNYQGSSNTPLPVELTSFTSKIINDKVQLNWSTKTEVNNFGFDVERQTKNGQWEKVGFVNGNGNSNSPKEYSYIDKNVIGGSKFLYRLKQVDNDGQFEYSDAVEVELVPNEYILSQNYPNPFNPTTKIRYQLPNESKVVIKVYNILGSEVMELLNEQKEAGVYEVEFKADNLSSGTYIYKINADNFVQTKKMILLK